MKNKLLVLLGGTACMLFFGLFSCGPNCGPFHDRFTVVGVDGHTFKATYDETAVHKLMRSEIENDSVEYHHYGIEIDPQIETYFAQATDHWNFSLIQSAYACSPPPLTTDEIIDSIVIVSETNFDLNHTAGIDLADLFDIVIRDDANGIWFEKYDLEDYLATNPYVPTNISLILKQPPGVTSAFSFLVKYYQNGIDANDYFEFTTNKITILRE